MTDPAAPVTSPPAEKLDLGKPHSARMYDYYLGGKDNFRADRQAAGQVIAAWPSALVAARTNRAFMHRATRVLAGMGIRQFLDIGTGIPTSPNLHEVAQRVTPDARIVYVDNDPIVLAHAHAMMTSTPEGRTQYVEADVTEPEKLLADPAVAETLDLSEPVMLSLNSVLHFIPDEWDAYGIVSCLMDALPSGSCLCISHVTPDFDPETMARVVAIYRAGGIPGQARTRSEVERFFTGLELLEPGLAVPHRWHPEAEESLRVVTGDLDDAEVGLWAGVARKP